MPIAKTRVFTQFSACCKKYFFQRHKDIVNSRIYSVFALGTHRKNSKHLQKVPKMTSKKHLVILASFFPTPGPEKRENTTRVKDCRESSPDLRAYARQPARGPLEGKGAAIEHKEELRVKDRNYRVFFGCHFFRSC